MHAMVDSRASDDKLGAWRLETDAEGIAWLHIDCPGAGTNVLSNETLRELTRLLAEVGQLSPKGLVILSDKPSGFIAGADVK